MHSRVKNEGGRKEGESESGESETKGEGGPIETPSVPNSPKRKTSEKEGKEKKTKKLSLGNYRLEEAEVEEKVPATVPFISFLSPTRKGNGSFLPSASSSLST